MQMSRFTKEDSSNLLSGIYSFSELEIAFL